MTQRHRTRVKICCISSRSEARAAIAAGADAVGLVSAMPSGPGVLSEARVAEIAASVAPPTARFLLTSRRAADAIAEQQRRCRVDTLQLVDTVQPGTHERLREMFPGVRIVQVVHIVDATSVREALDQATTADALLLDSGNPSLAIKELGGTGRVHDWQLSRRVVKEARVPVFLAGGLDANNVGAAIRAVRPWGIDVCSGVRRANVLDADRLERFMRAVAAG